jgi:hypothetical protein
MKNLLLPVLLDGKKKKKKKGQQVLCSILSFFLYHPWLSDI